MMNGSIRFDHVTFAYPDGTSALNDLTCSFGGHDHVALFGTNGSGKSTLFLALLGLLKPRHGSIYIDDTEVTSRSLNDIRAKIGLVFQNPDDQLFCPSIYDDVEFGPWNYGMSRDERDCIVESTLRELGLWHMRDRAPHHLSWGEKRRAALATVFAMKPEILLLDEPTAYLDPPSIRDLHRILYRYTGTMILATHNLAFAGALCSKAVIMDGGSIVFQGDTGSLLNDPVLLKSFNLHTGIGMNSRRKPEPRISSDSDTRPPCSGTLNTDK